jgi:putative DNA primase/helicase
MVKNKIEETRTFLINDFIEQFNYIDENGFFKLYGEFYLAMQERGITEAEYEPLIEKFKSKKVVNNILSDTLRQEVISFLKRKDYGNASELIVNEIKKCLYIYTTKDDKSNEMWVYEDGIYVPNGRSTIKEFVRRIMRDDYNIWLVNQVIAKIEADTQINPQDFFNNNYLEEIPVKNGILNIFTKDLKPFNPRKIFFNKIDAEYNSESKCEEIDKFLRSTLLTDKDVNVFYELGGSCLLKEYRFEKAFMFVGNGRNGKDKSLELIKRLIGIENCCSVPLSSLSAESFIISEFFGKMANIAGEISNKDLKETSTFKSLTGRSLQTAPRKFLNPIKFVNYAKFIFACNDLPMVYDVSKGFWDRWVLLEFPYTFVTKEELESSQDKTNLKLRDENIIERITTEEEMSGLLNKFLDGLHNLLVNKQFSSARGSEEVKNMWIRKSNSVMAFCFNMVEDSSESWISKKEFRKKYAEYCKQHKIPPKSDFVIKRTLEEMFGTVEENKEVNFVWEKVWGGIKWIN